MRNREIKKIGGSWYIQLAPADVKDFGLVEGDKVDIDDLELLKESPKRRLKK